MMISAKCAALRKRYLQTFVARTYAEHTEQYLLFSFHQEELHHLFLSDLVQGTTLLEVGSGPSVNFACLASIRFKDIVLSDLVEDSRLEIKKWLSNSADAIDWTPRAQQIAALEGFSNINEGATEIAERTRRAIRKVVPCDILTPGVLPEEDRETFDVVLSCNCLEGSTADHESFQRALFNMAALVKPGGLLVLAGVGGISAYDVGRESFPMVDLTDDVIKQAMSNAGLQVKAFSTRMYDGPIVEAHGKRFGFVVAAQKC
ncbi:unnamed protein product [Ixodes persulcatus]